jgi:hypothetical protein
MALCLTAAAVMVACQSPSGPTLTPAAPDATSEAVGATPESDVAWHFTDVTTAAGIDYSHGYASEEITEPQVMCGGAATGDYDGDGWVDLFAARGDVGPNLLYHNQGDGTFEEVGERAGVAFENSRICGPKFADLDGDRHLDLILPGLEGTPLRIMRNKGDGTFEDMTADSGIKTDRDTFSVGVGDYNRDGNADLYLTYWGSDIQPDVLWRGTGGGEFVNADAEAGIDWRVFGIHLTNLSQNFADINGDTFADLLVASDFQTTRVLQNSGGGAFANVTDVNVINDENGMGSAVADYDNDGDLDWFVTAIWDPVKGDSNWGESGNRLYRNQGDGTFEDVTDAAGVREGYWGWAPCFADFNNDGHQDIFHVNGYSENSGTRYVGKYDLWQDDPSRLFIAQGDGTFEERSVALGIDDRGQGRGVSCFDFDRDGDIDIFIANNQQPPKLYRNDGGNQTGDFLHFRVRGRPPNTEGLGTRIYVISGEKRQMRELQVTDNYGSQNPVEAHFGLGKADKVDEVQITWPNGQTTVSRDVVAGESVVMDEPD